MNPRLTNKDWSKLKGGIRRAFASSDLHKAVLDRVTVEHSDPKNPRCRYWGYCEVCGLVQPRWKLKVDHIDPIVALDSSFKEQGLDVTVDRAWCDISMLQAIDDSCHNRKTAVEKALKKELNRGKVDTGKKRTKA